MKRRILAVVLCVLSIVAMILPVFAVEMRRDVIHCSSCGNSYTISHNIVTAFAATAVYCPYYEHGGCTAYCDVCHITFYMNDCRERTTHLFNNNGKCINCGYVE